MHATGEYLLQRAHILYGALRHSMIWPVSSYLTLEKMNPNALGSEKDIMIYCVHGTADQPGSFSTIISQLDLHKGVKGIKSVKFPDRFKGSSIEDFAKELKNQIILDRSAHVILIGHSRGGLVASYFAEILALANGVNVHSVVSICSPFKGSSLAMAPLTWVSSSVSQMQNDSEYLSDLCHNIMEQTKEAPIMHDYLFFGASLDQVVDVKCCHPYESHEGRENVIVLDGGGNGHGHLSVMSSKKMIAKIQDHINSVSKNVCDVLTDDEELSDGFVLIDGKKM